MSHLSTNNLVELIDKRHRCLLQLCNLGRKQAELIAGGQMGPLIRLIGAKNQLIAALQSVEQGLAPYHAQDPEDRDWTTPEARERCAQQVDDCQQLMRELMDLERQNEQNIIERRDKVASQLQAAQAAGAARGAYQAHQLSAPQGPHPAPSTPTAPIDCDLHTQHLDLHSDA